MLGGGFRGGPLGRDSALKVASVSLLGSWGGNKGGGPILRMGLLGWGVLLLEVLAVGWAAGCCLGGFWLQQCRVTAPENGSL